MTLTYADFETATGIDVPAASTKQMPGHAEVTAIIADITAATVGEFEELTGIISRSALTSTVMTGLAFRPAEVR